MTFSPPTYTQTPNDLFALMPQLGDGELRILLAVVRETFGWHRPASKLSLTQMEKLTGMSRQGVVKSVRQCLKKGYLVREAHEDGYVYALNVHAGVVNVVDYPQSTTLTTLVNHVDYPQSTTLTTREPICSDTMPQNDSLKKDLKKDLKKEERKDVGDFVAAATPPPPSAFALPDSTDDRDTVAMESALLANSCSDPQPPISAAPPSPKLPTAHSQPRDDASLGTGLQQASFAADAPAETPQRRRSKARPLSAAAQIYKEIACLTPTKAQSPLLDGVADLDLWRETVSYWIAQGWKPTSLGGMLDRYGKALAANEKAAAEKEAAEKELAAQRRRARPLTAEERQRNLAILNAARGQWKSAD